MSAEIYLVKLKFHLSVEQAGLLILIKVSNTDLILIRSLIKLKFEIRSIVIASCFILEVRIHFL